MPSIYDDIHSDKVTFIYQPLTQPGCAEPPKRLFYDEADMLEDSVLFPNEQQEDPSRATVTSILSKWERGPPSLHRFVNDLDTDEESDIDFDEDHKFIKDGEDSNMEDDISDDDASEDINDQADSMDDQLYFSHDDEEGNEKDDIFAKMFQTDEEKGIYHIVKDWLRKEPPTAPDMQKEWDEFLDRDRAKSTESCDFKTNHC